MTDETPRVTTINPATSAILLGLKAVQDAVDNVAEVMQRRENQSPGMYRITPTGSPMGEGIGAQSTRLRVTHWVIAATAAGTFAVQVGSAVIAQVVFAAAGTLVVPLPITIDNGKDITTTGTAADVADSFLLGFTE